MCCQNWPKSLAVHEVGEAKSFELAELRSLFDSLDKNGDGTVSAEEWKSAAKDHEEMLRKYFGGGTVQSAFEKIDAAGDATGDESFNWEEFVAAAGMKDSGAKGAPAEAKSLEELRSLFDSFDKNGDGTVSAEEWKSVAKDNEKMLRKYFGGKTIQDAFDKIDAAGNATGDESFNWEEFVAAAGLKDSYPEAKGATTTTKQATPKVEVREESSVKIKWKIKCSCQ